MDIRETVEFMESWWETTRDELRNSLLDEQLADDILAYRYGVGGLHKCCGRGLFKDVVYVDVKSFYPNILLEYGLLPRDINEERYKELLDRKLKGDKSPQLKMALNIPTGKLRAANASKQDKIRGLAMCIIGQFIIASLMEGLERVAGCKIIQVNTDGIMFIPNKTGEFENDGYMAIIQAWQEVHRMPVSVVDIDWIEQEDVNNYRAHYTDGRTVCKGAKFKK